MKLQVIGCSHHNAPIAVRERLAFSGEQASAALVQLREQFADVEAVLLSTCNRVELYLAVEGGCGPGRDEIAGFLARFHGLDVAEVDGLLYQRLDREAVRHLFTVASSLDSMVVGEPQILAQVKQAYQQATRLESTGPLLHSAFQAASKVARRVAGETAIHQRRVSVPSVAVADFARQIFERFDDKHTLVIGAGEMAEETLQYLRAEGARDVTVVNRSPERARELADRWQGRTLPWDKLADALVEADLVISTTGSEEAVVTPENFAPVEARRYERPLFVLDLAVPRDFDPAVGGRPGVYLYSVDDLQAACQQNRRLRDKELPAAVKIIEHETGQFMAELHHRATAPVIRRLKQDWEKPKEDELRRLLNKLSDLDDHAKDEIRQSFDRLVNKLLHPPLESLRHESRQGIPSTLVEALAKLFQLKD
jgi:glutamyl-tRNA reductase